MARWSLISICHLPLIAPATPPPQPRPPDCHERQLRAQIDFTFHRPAGWSDKVVAFHPHLDVIRARLAGVGLDPGDHYLLGVLYGLFEMLEVDDGIGQVQPHGAVRTVWVNHYALALRNATGHRTHGVCYVGVGRNDQLCVQQFGHLRQVGGHRRADGHQGRAQLQHTWPGWGRRRRSAPVRA